MYVKFRWESLRTTINLSMCIGWHMCRLLPTLQESNPMHIFVSSRQLLHTTIKVPPPPNLNLERQLGKVTSCFDVLYYFKDLTAIGAMKKETRLKNLPTFESQRASSPSNFIG
eukprot:c13527_g1_i1 orf=263-601(+)